MNQDQKEIIRQLARLSSLLSMIPADDKVVVQGNPGQDDTIISDWLNEIRSTFFALSILISKELDLPLR